MVSMKDALSSLFTEQPEPETNTVLWTNLRAVGALVFLVMSCARDDETLTTAAKLRTRAETELEQRKATRETIDLCIDFVVRHFPMCVWEAGSLLNSGSVDWDSPSEDLTIEAKRMSILVGLTNALPSVVGDVLQLRGLMPIIWCIIGAEVHRKNPEFADSFLNMGTRLEPQGDLNDDASFLTETLVNPIVVSFVKAVIAQIPASAMETV